MSLVHPLDTARPIVVGSFCHEHTNKGHRDPVERDTGTALSERCPNRQAFHCEAGHISEAYDATCQESGSNLAILFLPLRRILLPSKKLGRPMPTVYGIAALLDWVQ